MEKLQETTQNFRVIEMRNNVHGLKMELFDVRKEECAERVCLIEDINLSISLKHLSQPHTLGNMKEAILDELETCQVCDRGCCFKNDNITVSNRGYSWDLNKKQYIELITNKINKIND